MPDRVWGSLNPPVAVALSTFLPRGPLKTGCGRSGFSSQRPQLLRVVGCLPSHGGGAAQWAGVLQASREETAECIAVVESVDYVAMGI
jgi:hypothetical protein